MKALEIETLLGKHLLETPDLPTVAWPARSVDPERPFVTFAHEPSARTDDTLDGGMEYARGSLIVGVVVTQGKFTTPALEIAERVMDQFQYGTVIKGETENILVISPPRLDGSGFRNGKDWRQPVRIEYQTEARPPE